MRGSTTRLPASRTVGLVVGLVVALAGAAFAVAVPPTSCTICHANPDLFDQEAVAMVDGYGGDVHASAGLSCHDCHGGNPDPKLADDLDAAMSESYAPNPYRGDWTPRDIPAACGRCHSDAGYMQRFRPDLDVGQEADYRDSHHGRSLAAGNDRAATCVSCHGVHDIKRASDPAARTHPTRVAETCGSCHSDAERMAGRKASDGRQLPVDQRAEWQVSVHAQAMEHGDLSAPTCNDCHGNHGSTPRGIESLAFACGQCHIRESELFLQSPKWEALQEHNGFLAEEGVTGCGDCHDPSEPAAAITGVHSFVQCVACHGNHAIARPTIAMLAPLPPSPCAVCHEGPATLDDAGRPLDAASYTTRRDALMTEGRALGLAGDDLFDWLVDQALALDAHVAPPTGDGARRDGATAAVALRPEFLSHSRATAVTREPVGTDSREFETLFRKMRIGKIHFELTSSASGETMPHTVVRCSTCHAREPLLGSAEGLPFAARYLDLMRIAAFDTARAERLILRARRGGVSVRGAQDEISRAIDAQIATQALLHSYSLEDDGELSRRFGAAAEHAANAARLAEAALRELQTRRRGLAASLVLVLVALVALAVKIRQLD